MQILKGIESITTLEDWKEHGAPKGKDLHWKNGRSAMECAKAWIGSTSTPAVPIEITDLLLSHADIRNCVIDKVIPEHPVRFDKLRGEPRNSDICCEAHDDIGALAISIEAKADEPFGGLIVDELQRIIKKISLDENSNGVERIKGLAHSLLPDWKPDLAHLGELRYQLLTGLAGAVAYAENISATRGVFIIHEFITSETSDIKHTANDEDLNRFIARFSNGKVLTLTTGRLYGPFTVTISSSQSSIKLYIGKVTRNLRPLRSVI